MEKTNKLIAEFMGIVKDDNKCKSGKLVDLNKDESIDLDTAVKHGLLKYETSWDWLMPVVKKCWEVGAKLDYCSALMLADYDFWYVAEGDFDKSYKAVVNFIKKHN